MATIRIHTPQNVTLEYEVASVGDRLLASFLDYLLYGVWFIFCGVVAASLHLGLNEAAAIFLVMLPPTFYFLACEVLLNGQTIGKKARNLRVMRLDGTRPGLGDYLLRWLLRPIEIVFTSGGPAIITILLNGKGQRLGDLAAGTTVVSLRHPAAQQSAQAADLLPAADYQPVFPQAAQLSDHDVALIRQLLFQAAQKQNRPLLAELAAKVKTLTGIQTELKDGIFLQTILRDHAHWVMQQG